jgi:hypothetical protein
MDAVALRPASATAAGTTVAGATGGFTLNTAPPGATVYVDGIRQRGTTPMTVTDLSEGTHRVRVELEGQGPWEDEVAVAAGQTATMPDVSLSPIDVRVRFASTPPGARVILVGTRDERVVGSTPTQAVVHMPDGPYTVRMMLAGHAEWSEPLEVNGADDELEVAATLQPADRPNPNPPAVIANPTTRMVADRNPRVAPVGTMVPTTVTPMTAGSGPGTLRVNTRPWSQVYVDGRLIGNTPQMNISLPAGTHRVTLVNPDFNIRQSVSVTIESGQVTTRVLTLERPE